MKNVAVVVGGDHYNTLWVARSLAYAGYKCDVIVFNSCSEKSFLSKSNCINSLTIIHSEQILIEHLLKIGNSKNKRVLLCSSDQTAELIDNNYNQLSAFYLMPNCNNTEGNLIKWMDKQNMLKLASELGLNVVNSIYLNLDNESLDAVHGINYPCLLKPEISSKASKSNFRICKNELELRSSLENLDVNCRKVIIQDYIEPDFEITACGLHYNMINILPGAVNKYFNCNSLSSLGMHCLSCVLDNFDKLVDRTLIEKFLTVLGYNGLYSVEFIIKNNKAYFLEINLRTDGTLYQNTIAGVNLPAIWMDLCLNGKTARTLVYSHIPTWGMCEFSYLKNMTRRNPIQVIKDWWKTDCYSIFNWNDPLPFIYKFLYAIK